MTSLPSLAPPRVTLPLADGLALPIEAVTAKFAILAQSGAGKSYTAMRLAELLLAVGAQIIALDPVGIWWGLRTSADGQGPGLPIAIFGGEHADVPLTVEMGERLAEVLVATGAPAVIDLSELTTAEHKRFVRDFAEAFYQAKKRAKGPVHLILEEAQEFGPQVPERDETLMLNRIERLTKLGRNFGIGWTAVSQQPQAVNKGILNQADTLMVLRTGGAHELKAILEWVRERARPDAGSEDLAALLQTLETGVAHVWSPAFLKVAMTVRISRRVTYDASATPVFGIDPLRPERVAPVDVAVLRAALLVPAPPTTGNAVGDGNPRDVPHRDAHSRRRRDAPSIAVADDAASDLAAARQQIAALTREVHALRSRPAPVPERIEVPVITDAQIEQLTRIVADLGATAAHLQNALQRVASTRQQVLSMPKNPVDRAVMPGGARVPTPDLFEGGGDQPMPAACEDPGARDRAAHPIPGRRRQAPATQRARLRLDLAPLARPARPAGTDDGQPDPHDHHPTITRPQQRLVDALAEVAAAGKADPLRHELAFWAGIQADTGSFNANLTALHIAGIVAYPTKGRIGLTEQGRLLAQPVVDLPANEDLQAQWLAKLSRPQATLLAILLDRYPTTLSRQELAEQVGVRPDTGSYNANLTTLRKLGLVEYPQTSCVAAAALLFPHSGPAPMG